MTAKYGAQETNGLAPGEMHEILKEMTGIIVDWTDPRLAKILRLRLLSDPGYPYWDVSYCHGRLTTGELVRVNLPFSQLRKGKPGISAQIVKHAKHDKVFAKKLGIFNAISTLC